VLRAEWRVQLARLLMLLLRLASGRHAGGGPPGGLWTSGKSKGEQATIDHSNEKGGGNEMR
jgi:hypothetical protein